MLLLVSYLYGNIASIGPNNIFIYGAFIFVQVYALTELMDRNKNAWIIEGVKNILCVYWIVTSGDWFGSNQLSTSIGPAAIVYFIASAVAVYYFSTIEKMRMIYLKKFMCSKGIEVQNDL